MIIKECFIKIKILENYLSNELIKGFTMLRIDNIARIIGNRFDDRNDLEYKRVFLELNNEILNVLKILKIVKQSKKNINTTDLEELKTYYLSMRFLISSCHNLYSAS